MSNSDVQVIPNPDGGWDVKRGGGERASSHHDRQSDAITAGQKTAERERVELVVHGTDGRIRSKDSFGNDPPERRDTEH